MRGVQLLVLFLALAGGAMAQESPRPVSGFDVTAQTLWSFQYESGSPAEDIPGGGVGLGYRLPNGLAFELAVHDVVTLAPFAGAGPSVIWGNDWASVFASFDVGARVYVALARDSRVRLSLEAGYGRAPTFHPSEFGVLNLGGGLSLGL